MIAWSVAAALYVLGMIMAAALGAAAGGATPWRAENFVKRFAAVALWPFMIAGAVLAELAALVREAVGGKRAP